MCYVFSVSSVLSGKRNGTLAESRDINVESCDQCGLSKGRMFAIRFLLCYKEFRAGYMDDDCESLLRILGKNVVWPHQIASRVVAVLNAAKEGDFSQVSSCSGSYSVGEMEPPVEPLRPSYCAAACLRVSAINSLSSRGSRNSTLSAWLSSHQRRWPENFTRVFRVTRPSSRGCLPVRGRSIWGSWNTGEKSYFRRYSSPDGS